MTVNCANPLLLLLRILVRPALIIYSSSRVATPSAVLVFGG